MDRRTFLASSAAASALGITTHASAQTPPSGPREFYLLRRYQLQSGPQTKLTESYFSDALIPALTRMGLGPVGAFRIDFGPDTPAYYLLIPGSQLETLAALDLKLAGDQAFLKAADPYWSATAIAPAYQRIESWLLQSFAGWPKVTPPASAATKGKRIFQLRTYESPSFHAHEVKVRMFHSGEFDIFKAAGFRPVFFGDTLVGPRMPSLTYMLAFDDVAQLEAQWNTFRNDPNWKKLSADPRFAYEAIVSNITNLYLSPLSASQI